MTSRYSRIFLRPPKGTTLSSESWAVGSSTTADPRSTDTQGFSYPPSGSSPSHDTDAGAMASPPPHPYTLGAVHSLVLTEPREPPSSRPAGQLLQSTSMDAEKRPNKINPVPQQRRTLRQTRRASSLMPSPVPLRLRPIFLLLLFLPIPPLLAMIYMVTGHAILRAAHSSPESIYHAPIVSSLEAGATGGVILALPLALLLYLLLFPNKSEDAPEDFFEDDGSSVMGIGQWLRLAGYVTSVFFFFIIGGLAGPLGVTCLPNNAQTTFVGEQKLLSSGAAAAAGFVGGAVLAFAVTIGGVLATLIGVRSHRPQSSA